MATLRLHRMSLFLSEFSVLRNLLQGPDRNRLRHTDRALDPLTRVANADTLRERLHLEFERGTRDCHLLMLDLDNFHLINRDHGEREGDRLLQSVTHTLVLNLRSSDLLCRYAGDRFAVLLPRTDPACAQVLAEHLRRAIATLRHHAQRGGHPLCVSARYSLRRVDHEPRELLNALNRALERPASKVAAAVCTGA